MGAPETILPVGAAPSWRCLLQIRPGDQPLQLVSRESGEPHVLDEVRRELDLLEEEPHIVGDPVGQLDLPGKAASAGELKRNIWLSPLLVAWL